MISNSSKSYLGTKHITMSVVLRLLMVSYAVRYPAIMCEQAMSSGAIVLAASLNKLCVELHVIWHDHAVYSIEEACACVRIKLVQKAIMLLRSYLCVTHRLGPLHD